MQFQVPQFIETEDKIVGPLSLKQFIYVAAAGGVSTMLFFQVQFWTWFIGSIIALGFALAISFVKINGRSLPSLLGSAFSFYWKPQTYIWQSGNRQQVKKEEVIRSSGISDIVSGVFLKKTFANLQTGTKTATKETIQKAREVEDKYQIFQRLSGDRQAARRIDYR